MGNLKVVPFANGRSAQLTWTAPEVGYASDYRVRRTDPSNPGVITTIFVPGTSHILEGLQPGAIYSFDVAAQNPAGIGPVTSASAMMNFVPNLPVSVVITPSSDGEEAELTWTAPDSNGTPITSYKVTRTNPSSGVITTRFTTTPHYSWAQLTPGATYTFTVAAQNAVGFGLPVSKTLTLPVP